MNHHCPKLLWCGSYVWGSHWPPVWLDLRPKVFLLFINSWFQFLNTSWYCINQRCWQHSWWHYCTPSSPPKSKFTKIRKEITEWTAHSIILDAVPPDENVIRDFIAVSSPVAWGNKQAWGARKRWSRSRHVILAPGSASASPQARKDFKSSFLHLFNDMSSGFLLS